MSQTTIAAPTATAVPARLRPRLYRPMPPDRMLGWLLPLVVTLIGGILRFTHLNRPKGLIFDEVYYAKVANDVLIHGVSVDKHQTGPNYEVPHPPLGSWMIAFGEWLFGHNEFGWRFSSAIVGTLAILITARLARRIFRSTLLGTLAGLFLAVESLELVQSRVAMLDIFLMFWILVGVTCFVIDRDESRRKLDKFALDHGPDWSALGPKIGFRWWRLLGGITLGLATGVKWNGGYYLIAMLLVSFYWDYRARRVLGVTRPLAAAGWRNLPSIIGAGLAGFAAYSACWTGWFTGGKLAYFHDTYLHGQGPIGHVIAVLRGWIKYHKWAIDFGTNLSSSHPYQSNPFGWLLVNRPVLYMYSGNDQLGPACRGGQCSSTVLGMANPAVFWAMIPGILVLIWMWIANRDWRAPLMLLIIAVTIVPWIYFYLKDNRTEFFFYVLPACPFFAISLALICGWILGRGPLRTMERYLRSGAVTVYSLAVVVLFVYFYPILTAAVIPYNEWRSRIWFHGWW